MSDEKTMLQNTLSEAGYKHFMTKGFGPFNRTDKKQRHILAVRHKYWDKNGRTDTPKYVHGGGAHEMDLSKTPHTIPKERPAIINPFETWKDKQAEEADAVIVEAKPLLSEIEQKEFARLNQFLAYTLEPLRKMSIEIYKDA